MIFKEASPQICVHPWSNKHYPLFTLSIKTEMIMKTVISKNKIASQQDGDLPKLAQPALRALAGAGVHRLEQLTVFSETEIKQLHGMGPKALGQLRQALADRGLSFVDKKGN